MPHIHTKPGQHDFTTSAYIVRMIDGEWRCMVHMHKKLGILMQIGGHVELDETPWSTLAHELKEESGYLISELLLLQPNQIFFDSPDYVVHPVPLTLNTHKFSDDHYHTDIAYAFIAQASARTQPAEGESVDIRWLSISQMKKELVKRAVLRDVVSTYRIIVEQCVEHYSRVETSKFSLYEPTILPKDA